MTIAANDSRGSGAAVKVVSCLYSLTSERSSSRKPGFQCISVPEIGIREELPSAQRKAAGWSLEATMVDRD